EEITAPLKNNGLLAPFVIVNACVSAAVFGAKLPNESVVALNAACPDKPVPFSATDCGASPSASPYTSVALRAPQPVGANRTVTVQLAPVVSDAPQEVDGCCIVKSAEESESSENATVLLLAFVSVIVLAALLV